ncbi:hypothetical protein BC829DRAFT_394551, partial [Chytridium lagenaria]
MKTITVFPITLSFHIYVNVISFLQHFIAQPHSPLLHPNSTPPLNPANPPSQTPRILYHHKKTPKINSISIVFAKPQPFPSLVFVVSSKTL